MRATVNKAVKTVLCVRVRPWDYGARGAGAITVRLPPLGGLALYLVQTRPKSYRVHYTLLSI